MFFHNWPQGLPLGEMFHVKHDTGGFYISQFLIPAVRRKDEFQSI